MNNDTASFVRYSVAVRGLRGRKWFRADSAATTDQAFVQGQADELNAEYPGLRFAAMPTEEIEGLTAPAKYRPWDTTPDEDEVDVDALSDEEL